MRSFEVIMPEANRPGSRLQPKRHGVALVQRDSIYIPGDPDVGAPKVARFGFERRSFKEDVHIFALGLKGSRNYIALLAAQSLWPCVRRRHHKRVRLTHRTSGVSSCNWFSWS